MTVAIADYTTLLRMIRDRVVELGITHETLDAVSGLQTGYASKLLCDPPIKRMGPFTLFLVMQTLGLEFIVRKKPAENIAKQLIRRRRPRVLTPASITFTNDYYLRITSQGGAARAQRLPPRRRSQIARQAAIVRWSRQRQKQLGM